MTSKKRTCGDLTEGEKDIFFGKLHDLWLADDELTEADVDTNFGETNVNDYYDDLMEDSNYVLEGETIEKCAENYLLKMRSKFISELTSQKNLIDIGTKEPNND